MGKTLMMAIMAAVATLLAATWLYCWYNKDRYQFIPSQGTKYSPASIFDRNTGNIVK